MDVKQVFRDSAKDAQVVAEIETMVQQNQLPRAVEMARAALDRGVIHPMLLNLRSFWHSREGRRDDALSDLRIAFQLAPSDVFVRNALSSLLIRLGELPEAQAILEESVRIAPGFAPAQYSLGWLYAFNADLPAAQRCFETAIAIHPDFVEALGHLASLHAMAGDWPLTEEFANRALAIESGYPVALTALATAALAKGDLDGTEALLARMGDLAQLPPLEASLALDVKAKLHEARSR